MSWPWGAYLGEDSLTKGITAKDLVLEARRPNVIPHVSKATGSTSTRCSRRPEAQRAGYDEGILLTDNGFVADGPARTSSSSRTADPDAAALDVDPPGHHAATPSSRSPATSATSSRRRT
jgi:hypothetical protein